MNTRIHAICWSYLLNSGYFLGKEHKDKAMKWEDLLPFSTGEQIDRARVSRYTAETYLKLLRSGMVPPQIQGALRFLEDEIIHLVDGSQSS
jgi:hypothetical protein